MTLFPPHSEEFTTAVQGTVFGHRAEVVHRLREGDYLILVPDPPGTMSPRSGSTPDRGPLHYRSSPTFRPTRLNASTA
jgi:hypothetical protein